jgi:N-acetylglutamate synthase-like GNAT family acetyltransferase
MSDNSLKIEDLEWIRIFDPVHIPRYLVEQVRDKDWSVDKFYQYQKIINLQKDGSNVVINPMNLLFVLADKEKVIHGFMWAAVDALSNCLVINTFSVDKKYWGQGNAVSILEKKTKEIANGAKLSKIYWITNYPKHSEKHGFKRSKSVLMEYNMEEEDGQNICRGGRQTSRSSEFDGSGSDAISDEHITGSRTTSDAELSRTA